MNALGCFLSEDSSMAVATESKWLSVNGIGRCCGEVELRPSVSDAQAESYAGWFKALADPTRIRILNLLAQSDDPVCVCDITDQFPLGQPTISHHLKVLRDVRFVIAERRGTFMHYQVNQACLAEFPDAARRILNT